MKFGLKMVCLACLPCFLFSAVNLNTASKEELMALDGIGEAKANAIIEYRKTNKFNTIEDIKNVKGIGEKRFEAIKDDLSVSGNTDISNLTSKKSKQPAKPKTPAKNTNQAKDTNKTK